MEDEKIVDLYWQRDEVALEATKQKYDPYLKKIAYNILADTEDSEESVNDTYLAAWNSIPPNRPKILRTYLSKIVRRVSIDIIRRKSRAMRSSQYTLSLSELSEFQSTDPCPQEEAEYALLSKKISDFLYLQKPESRKIFICRYYYLDPVKDIASYMGITEGKVKTVLHRMRLSLKEYLEKEGFFI